MCGLGGAYCSISLCVVAVSVSMPQVPVRVCVCVRVIRHLCGTAGVCFGEKLCSGKGII